MQPLGKVALITGAGSGIGCELARLLAAQGVRIAAIDVAEAGLAALEAELQAKNQPVACAVADVTNLTALREQVAALETKLGPVELLIASAGIASETGAVPFHADRVAAIINVNLIGVSNSIAAVLPGMITRRGGHIVGLSSLASFRGLPRMFGYSASKAGLNSLLEGLRVELRRFNIAVTTLCPGWIRTPMTAQVKAPMPGLMDVSKAAQYMLEAIRRRRLVYAFPAATARRLRFLRFLPASVSDWIIHRAMSGLR